MLVVVPTYNEIESLERVLGNLHRHVPAVDVLVVDDASPDGTGKLADRLARGDDRIHVLHGTAKSGLGQAYLSGFAWARARHYDVVVEMDADGSHPAETLPAMLDRLVDPDRPVGLVIGSRWVAGGAVENWPARRRLLSRAGNEYARLMLPLRVHDATAGYRAYDAGLLDQITTRTVVSRGYCFQIDMALRAHDAGAGIAEVPIVFRERQTGVSKMSRGIVFEALLRVTQWGIVRLFTPRTAEAARAADGDAPTRSAA
ncbi:polyprenol monophosphomannose synthase [Conyzicola nivalis]|uniref:Dolichol-phosphate mannosyltransferase n=1 Tax=Conyzicola nivalis TaxID=1477021 RepID=A0A916SLR4_9MICO|nr:dolichol-phosphate mannosyltransferase [Conyzicola nivalis]